MRMSEAFTAQLGELTDGADAKSLLFQFEDTQISELTKALDAPICEFVRGAFYFSKSVLYHPELIH
jgi:hypothetical protein